MIRKGFKFTVGAMLALAISFVVLILIIAAIAVGTAKQVQSAPPVVPTPPVTHESEIEMPPAGVYYPCDEPGECE